MQNSLKEELDQYTMPNMTLWEMTRLGTDEHDFGNAMAGSSNMGHARSISSESVSSSTYAQQNTLTRTHPSLNYNTSVDPSIYLSSSSAVDQGSALSIPPTRNSPPQSHLSRRRATPRSDEEDELADEPLDPNASEQVKQAYKRRRNTLAARRSRQRRQAQFQRLEETVARLNRERDIWKERALMMERMLSTHGLPCPNFADR